MPRVAYTQQSKNAGDVDRFPRLKLERGEKSRLWLPEEPFMEWYHRLEAPLVEGGEVAMEIKDTKRGPVEVMKMDWIGNVFCLGQTGTSEEPGPLMLHGIDPENCPACESAMNKTGVRPPEQRFAVNVIKYKIRGRGPSPYDLASPIRAEILVWAYTGRQHSMLFDMDTRFGDLRKLDVTIELEDSPGADKYQKIKTLSVIPEPAWKDPKVKAYLRDLWGGLENRATDEQLRDACLGRDVPRVVMMDMVRRAERQFRDAERSEPGGGDTGQADGAFNGDLAEGIDSLLDSGPAAGSAPDGSASDDEDYLFEDHPGGAEEFASAEQLAAVREAKAQAQREVAEIVSPDPFGAADTGIPEPGSAASISAESPADAGREQAVQDAADDMFGESQGPAEPAAPATGNGRKPRTKAAPAAEPSLEAPEPASAPVAAGGVVDFDDLFKD